MTSIKETAVVIVAIIVTIVYYFIFRKDNVHPFLTVFKAWQTGAMIAITLYAANVFLKFIKK